MKLAIASVPLIKIRPSLSRWHFSDAELDHAAHLLLDVNGSINPIVLCRQESIQWYEILDGNFESYAAARAQALEPKRFREVDAYVVEVEDLKIIHQQIELFRSRRPDLVKLERSGQWEARVSQLEGRLDRLESCPRSVSRGQSGFLDPLTSRRLGLLNAFNDLNTSDLLQMLKRVALIGKNAERVVEEIEEERERHPFQSLRDVVKRVKGLSSERMVELIETA